MGGGGLGSKHPGCFLLEAPAQHVGAWLPLPGPGADSLGIQAPPLPTRLTPCRDPPSASSPGSQSEPVETSQTAFPPLLKNLL